MGLIINDIQLEGDLTDANFLEIYEPALKKLMDEVNAAKKTPHATSAGAIRALCEPVDRCFDEIFGPNTSMQLFEGRMAFVEHMDALNKLVEWKRESEKEFNDVLNRYAQRQQRASAQPPRPYYQPRGKGKRH